MLIKDYFEGYLNNLEKSGWSRKTISEDARFISFIGQALGTIHIKDLRLAHKADVIDIGLRHGQHGSVRAIVVFRKFLRYIQQLGIVTQFDWRDISVPKTVKKEVEYLEPDELEKVRNSFDLTTIQGLRTRTLIEVLLDTGLRISEAISLNKKDIDYEKREARVINIKSKIQQTVYFTDRSLFWVKKYLEKRSLKEDECPALFTSGRGRLLSVSSRNYLAKHTKHLGIKKHIRHHICRATLATQLARNADLKTAQDILRHESDRTTARYYVGINKERSKALHQEIMTRNFNPIINIGEPAVPSQYLKVPSS